MIWPAPMKPWYDYWGIVITCLIVLWPVGLYALYRSGTIHWIIKGLVTAFIFFGFYLWICTWIEGEAYHDALWHLH